MSRNELCSCGSGKRFKHCHGMGESEKPPSSLHLQALAAHQAGALRQAEALYLDALAANPGDVDSLHMLGVVQFERMRYAAALGNLLDAAQRTGWSVSLIRHNLGLVLAKLMSPCANVRQEALVAAYRAQVRARSASPVDSGRVSVIVAVRNDAEGALRSIESSAAQTAANIELVVVDDGSTDASAATVLARIVSLAVPARLLRQAHLGAARAANAGAENATGRYLALLDCGDRFTPDRIERMRAQIARGTPQWGFSQVVDDEVEAADREVRASRAMPSDEPLSFTLLHADVSAAPGNLFIERGLFLSLGGYRESARYRGWDLCARAAQAIEPVAVREPLYFRGSESGEPVPVSASPASRPAMAQGLIAQALGNDRSVPNELCPQHSVNRDLVLRDELRGGRGELLPVAMLRELAGEWNTRVNATRNTRVDTTDNTRVDTTDNARVDTTAVPARARLARSRADRTALVVLGPYRSGTSALARVLNLCGAMLPEGVIPARLGVNPTGFWETESISDLDARLLHRLGGDWNRVAFELPRRGVLVDEFVADVGDVLAGEYGDSPFILIKDPRICVLAPLWQQALVSGGYRAAYVVAVRNPLEVARSLESRGDMPVRDGLALWLAYMQRVEAFTTAHDGAVIHVRYDEVLADWRAVVRRLANRLDIPLAVTAEADAVDRFLSRDLHNQRATDTELDSHADGTTGREVVATYRHALARCEHDASHGRTRVVF
ncbi:MAG: glycosyltransferase [Casimicrobiaceae bacterium]